MPPSATPDPLRLPQPDALPGDDGRASGAATAAEGGAPRAFRSVLFGASEAPVALARCDQPAFFADLNLDQVVRSVVAGRDAYELEPLFHWPLRHLDTICFRQEIFRDLERPEVYALAAEFAKHEIVARYASQRHSMVEDHVSFQHPHYARNFLNAAVDYCDAVERLADGLVRAGARSRGLLGLREHLAAYLAGEPYRTLASEARALDRELDQVRYSFLLKGSRITVGPYDEQPDYSAQVTATFERFQQGAATSYLPRFRDDDTYAAIGVLHLVANVYPDLFGELDAFCARHADYLDPTIRTLDRELQFYLSYLEYLQPLRDAGLEFSHPHISTHDKAEQALDTFDLALAAERAKDRVTVVCNDLRLEGPERILVITGPNNGGKTTLARTIGQLHYLARLGCPVPGRDVRLFLCDAIFTHFERRESITTLTGKLSDELNRLRESLQDATPDSLFILNEMFNSTTAHDALFLSREILARIGTLDALCACVTFLDELTVFNDKTVSVVSTVDPADPAIRTYKLVRRPADGRAYARAIAEKYGLTYGQLTRPSQA